MKSDTTELLASVIQEAKDQLFFASSLAALTAIEHRIDLGIVQQRIDRAAENLNQVLLAYQFERGEIFLSISTTSIRGLLEEAAAISREQYLRLGLTLEHSCISDETWPLDRGLVLDVITNALGNAAHSAKSKVTLTARHEDETLLFRMEDDGPGYSAAGTTPPGSSGLGLYIGRQIARLHHRHGRNGELNTYRDTHNGGAVFEFRLP